MTYSRDTTAISEITGQSVNTWSEEWQAECEASDRPIDDPALT